MPALAEHYQTAPVIHVIHIPRSTLNAHKSVPPRLDPESRLVEAKTPLLTDAASLAIEVILADLADARVLSADGVRGGIVVVLVAVLRIDQHKEHKDIGSRV